MIGEFLDYWGLNQSPFALCPDPKMFYLSRQHRECLMRLEYAIDSNKGGAMIVSDKPGAGKTSLLRYLMNRLNERSSRTSFRFVY